MWKEITVACASLTLGACMPLAELGSGSRAKEGLVLKDDEGLKQYRLAGGRIISAGNESRSGSPQPGELARAGITPEEDIVWAPEDPNAPISDGLEEIWKQPKNIDWQKSFQEAIELSRTSGKPMLVWFTDSVSASSVACSRLSSELFSTSEFDKWARENVIRLRIDHAEPRKEKNQDLSARKQKYINQLKIRYQIHGHPTVLIISPIGSSYAKIRGYKKNTAQSYWEKIKNSVKHAKEDYISWEKKLKQKGYRIWMSHDGRKKFARLYRLLQNKVSLVDPEGNMMTTDFSNLSEHDKSWILKQRKKSGLEH